MFFMYQKLNYLDVTSFRTQKVETMSIMFYGCRELISLNLKNFDVYK